MIIAKIYPGTTEYCFANVITRMPINIRGGAEYKATDKLALRFGGGYATTAVEDGYVTPEAPDANRAYVNRRIRLRIR